MKQEWPAPARNAEPIFKVLAQHFSDEALVLEISSGTGQHASYLCERLQHLRWQCTDMNQEHLASQRAWKKENALGNFLEPQFLDVTQEPWPLQSFHYLFCANMIHIAPWECTEALFAGIGRGLSANGKAILYGPYLEAGVKTAESNLRFDASLRSRDPSWGIRTLSEVEAVAEQNGLRRVERIAMPANNLCLVFVRN